jgi:hypothetical protein
MFLQQFDIFIFKGGNVRSDGIASMDYINGCALHHHLVIPDVLADVMVDVIAFPSSHIVCP